MANNTGDIPPPAPIAVILRTGILLIDFCGLLLFGAIIIVTVRHKSVQKHYLKFCIFERLGGINWQILSIIVNQKINPYPALT
jgi:hypothetical protein